MSHPDRKPLRKRAKAVARRPLPSRANPRVAILLAAVADALNACHRSGVAVELVHGAVVTEQGYVFAVGPDEAPWTVRTKMLTEFPVPPGDD